MCQSRSKSLEKRGEDTITPALVELSKRMSEPPADVKKGLLISAFLRGIGAVYQGDTPKGYRIFLEALLLSILSILTSPIFFPDGPVMVGVLHSMLMIGVIWVWVYSMTRTIQFYEAEIRLWMLTRRPDRSAS